MSNDFNPHICVGPNHNFNLARNELNLSAQKVVVTVFCSRCGLFLSSVIDETGILKREQEREKKTNDQT